jgi:hypothetical protein
MSGWSKWTTGAWLIAVLALLTVSVAAGPREADAIGCDSYEDGCTSDDVSSSSSFPFRHELDDVAYPSTGEGADGPNSNDGNDDGYYEPSGDDSDAHSDSDSDSAGWSFGFDVDHDDDPDPHASFYFLERPGRDSGSLFGAALAGDDTHDYEVELELGWLDDHVVYSLGFEHEAYDGSEERPDMPWRASALPAWRTARAGVEVELPFADWSPRVAGASLGALLPGSIAVAFSRGTLDTLAPEFESEAELELGWSLGLADAELNLSRSWERSGPADDRGGATHRAGRFAVEVDRELWSFNTGFSWKRVQFAEGMWLEFERERSAFAEVSFQPRVLPPVSVELEFGKLDGSGGDYSFNERSWVLEAALDLTRLVGVLQDGELGSLELGYAVRANRLDDNEGFREDDLLHGVTLRFDFRF